MPKEGQRGIKWSEEAFPSVARRDRAAMFGKKKRFSVIENTEEPEDDTELVKQQSDTSQGQADHPPSASPARRSSSDTAAPPPIPITPTVVKTTPAKARVQDKKTLEPHSDKYVVVTCCCATTPGVDDGLIMRYASLTPFHTDSYNRKHHEKHRSLIGKLFSRGSAVSVHDNMNISAHTHAMDRAEGQEERRFGETIHNFVH